MHMLVSWRSAASLVLWVAAGAVVSAAVRACSQTAYPAPFCTHTASISTSPQACNAAVSRRIHLTRTQAARLLRLKTRWRLRTLPLPRASPLLGNLPAIVSTPGGFTGWRDAMYKVYGKVYQVRRSTTCLLTLHTLKWLKPPNDDDS